MDKIIPVKPITLELFKEAEEAARQAGKLKEKIVDRLHYIMTSIFKTYGKSSAYWYFYGAAKGEVGDLWEHVHEHYIWVVIDNCPGEGLLAVLKDGSEWDFQDAIPLRWLYEDFEDELAEGKKKYKELEVARKEAEKVKRQKTKQENAALAKSARAKLSKEELAALKTML